jgi:hypothetical protein
VNGFKTSGTLPSTVRQGIGSKLESHAPPMLRVIASLYIDLSGGSVRLHNKRPIVGVMRIRSGTAYGFSQFCSLAVTR